MKRTSRLTAILLTLALALTGCTLSLGETMMPNPPPGRMTDRSVGPVAPVPDPIAHTLEGREECYTCHAIGAVDAPPVPDDHDEDVTLCTTCHAVWLIPAVAAAAPPAITHEIEGNEDCLTCHKLGAADAPRIPENHAGLTNAMCQTCHRTVGELVGGAGGEGESEALSLLEAAPANPHPPKGYSACLRCHEKGGPRIPKYPDDHEGRTEDMCGVCHKKAGSSSSEVPPAELLKAPVGQGVPISGQDLCADYCARCHGPNGEGAKIAPEPINDAAFLAKITDDDITRAIRLGMGGDMPAMPELSDQEVLDLIALLRSWQ